MCYGKRNSGGAEYLLLLHVEGIRVCIPVLNLIARGKGLICILQTIDIKSKKEEIWSA